jgi:hypothetical protein
MPLAMALVGASLAAPGQATLTAAVGMRAGARAAATVDLGRWAEAGGGLTVARDVYAGAPDWVTDGLTVQRNLRLAPHGLAGVHTPPARVQGALLAGLGTELLHFEETRAISGGGTASYATTEFALYAGVSTELRVAIGEHLGAHLSAWLPLPFSPTGAPNIERTWAGLGITYRWGDPG